MLQDVIHQMSEQLPLDDVSSPINAQLLEFCDSEFFQETMQNSDVTSSSNGCYDENSPYTKNLPLPPDLEKYNNNNNTAQDINNGNTTTSTNNNNNNNNGRTTSNTTTSAATTANTTTNSSNLSSIMFDPQDELDNDISASIDFSSSPVAFSDPPFSHNNNNFYFTSIHPQAQNHGLSLSDCMVAEGIDHDQDHHHHHHHHHHHNNYNHQNIPQLVIPSLFEEDCLSSVPSYAHFNPASPSCSFLGTNFTTFMPSGAVPTAENSGIFTGRIYTGNDQLLHNQELDYQGDNGGVYCPSDSLQRVFNPADLQAFGNETKRLVGGAPSSTPLTTELASLEDSSFKVGKLSVEQRKEKIHRYMKKRNERNFSKKIKYACRKTLADSRPRVRGRFAKNDDLGETIRAACSNHEDEEDDERVSVKEEEEMVDSADIFAHINGMNSFNKCNYSIQSLI